MTPVDHKVGRSKVGILRDLPVGERPMSYQLVGEVTAHQGYTGTGTERLARRIGTETLPRLLREAAVTNIPQWTKV